jgi:hypothetical protein
MVSSLEQFVIIITTRYKYYNSIFKLIGPQKDAAVEEIFERITQDVFNASLAKW